MRITRRQLKKLIKETIYVNPQGTAVNSRTARDDYYERINSYKGPFKEKIPSIIPDTVDDSNIEQHRSMSLALAGTLDGSNEEQSSFDADTDLALTAIDSENKYPKRQSGDPVPYELVDLWENQMRQELTNEIVKIISSIKDKSVRDFGRHIKRASDDEVLHTQISGLPENYSAFFIATYEFIFKPVIKRLLNKSSLKKMVTVGKIVLGEPIESWIVPMIKRITWNESYRDMSWVQDRMFELLEKELKGRGLA